jgi:hypothetical protein
MGKIRLKKEEDWDMNRLVRLRRIKSYLLIHRFSTAGIDGIKLTMIYKVVDNY